MSRERPLKGLQPHAAASPRLSVNGRKRPPLTGRSETHLEALPGSLSWFSFPAPARNEHIYNMV
ncbi:hypothetical protein HMPREF1981_00744 [Bacteroides pyogenes F0041]|uniref:Uncharacterized protein n=1 Tax=Bacteroides pyogenes F0041 TaxID=1321819 RepID=U2E3F9_9BACE|nr:hypothetical protein HMPREF1981_00744 [Bacteroides pyogenes F0041]